MYVDPLDTELSRGNVKNIFRFSSIPQHSKDAGGRLNKKDGLTRYGDSHVKDKTS